MAKAKRGVPEGYHTITAGLWIDGAAEAIKWYQKALGAEEKGRMAGPDGKIMHAELKIGDSYLFLSDQMMDAKTARQLGGTPMSLMIYVDDADALFNRALEAGAKVKMPIADMFWGDRYGRFIDPFGHDWGVATRKEDLTEAEIGQRFEAFMKQMAQQQPKK
jgi:PhnB protein